MITRVIISAALGGLALGPGRPLVSGAREPVVSCLPAGPTSSVLVDLLTRMVTGADSASAATRAANHLPAIPASDVQVVADTSVCSAAASAQAQLRSKPVAPVLVIRLSPTRYAVHDPRVRVGSFEAVFVYDDSWAYLGAFTS